MKAKIILSLNFEMNNFIYLSVPSSRYSYEGRYPPLRLHPAPSSAACLNYELQILIEPRSALTESHQAALQDREQPNPAQPAQPSPA